MVNRRGLAYAKAPIIEQSTGMTGEDQTETIFGCMVNPGNVWFSEAGVTTVGSDHYHTQFNIIHINRTLIYSPERLG